MAWNIKAMLSTLKQLHWGKGGHKTKAVCPSKACEKHSWKQKEKTGQDWGEPKSVTTCNWEGYILGILQLLFI